MPLTEAERNRVQRAESAAAVAGSNRLLVRAPDSAQKLGPFSVACIILNRTIATGIFVSPAIALKGTGSVGVSLLLWATGAIVGISGLLVWLELGLSLPKYKWGELPDRDPNETRGANEKQFECVPRNGGEKNYLEDLYANPKFRTTCMYGVIFVILGNRSGNGIAVGLYIMEAAGYSTNSEAPAVRGLAVAALTLSCLIHASWRKGGVAINNIMAFIKVLILLGIIGIGFAASAGASFGHGPVHGKTFDTQSGQLKSNFDTHTSFSNTRSEVGSYASSLLFIVYSFSGFDQPFYVLSEVSRPKKTFAISTISTMIFVAILFNLVNIAYLCAVSNDQRLNGELDMATLFFSEVFGNDLAPRIMAGIIAFSVFGNIIVTTFTASRVKQEIAKEGILPFSHFFARSTVTPYARLMKRWFPSKLAASSNSQPEESPIAAIFLHWMFSVILVGATSGKAPSVAFTILVSLYSYTVFILAGFFVSTGLLYRRWSQGKTWTNNAGFLPWGGPAAAIIFSVICAFLLICAFLPPSANSPFAYETTGVRWYIIPAVGLGTLPLGYTYYLVFAHVIPRLMKRVLVVEREGVLVKEGGEWVQVLELISFIWEARKGPRSGSPDAYSKNSDISGQI